MNAQQLKNSILQLAVQGKLVPQNNNDEPASELIKRIKLEKEKLVKEKKIKADKNPSEIFRGSDNLPYEKVGKETRCIADEVPFEIPDSWEWVRLGNISIINGGYAFKSTNFTEEGIRVIRISDFNEQGFVNNKIVRHKYDDTLAAYLLEPKNILLCMTGGTVGKSYFIEKLPEKMVTNQRVATIKFLQLIPEYGNLVILSPHIQKVISESKNSTNDNISMDTIKDFFVPLPSIEEQIKIVEQYNKLLPFIIEYDKAETKNNELNITFPDKLKKSILQDAVQGKLVPKNNNDEPASVLIEKIRKEKAQLIKNKKIKKDKNESYIFRRDNSHYEILNGKENCIDDLLPFEIPDSWEWARLGSIVLKLSDGTHSTPKYLNQGIPFLSVKDISSGIIDFSDTKFISIQEHKELYKRCNPVIGDLLLTKVGTTGIPVVVDTEKEFSLFVSVALLKFNKNFIFNKFLKYLILSPLVQNQAKENTKGVGNKNWVMRDIANTLIPLPPISEQQRIVVKIEELLPQIDKLKI